MENCERSQCCFNCEYRIQECQRRMSWYVALQCDFQHKYEDTQTSYKNKRMTVIQYY